MADPQDAGAQPEPTAPEPSGVQPQPQVTGEGASAGDVGQPAQTPSSPAPDPGQASDSSETFFDPADVPEELKPAYKQMQAAFTRKTQGLAKERQKVEAYDAFARDPVGALQRLASQYGFTVSRAGDQQSQQQGANGQGEEWQPKTWNDVLSKATEIAKSEMMQDLQPLLSEFQNVKKSQIETVLDQEFPEWRQYEDDMVQLLNEHPTLSSDPSKLARLALPPEVIEGRAMQRALKKLEAKGKSSQVSGASKTQQPANTGFDPNKPVTFHDAYLAARQQGEREGWLNSGG